MVRRGSTDIPITDKNVVKSVQDIMVGEVLVSRLMALDAIVLEMNAIHLGDLLRAEALCFPIRSVMFSHHQSNY